jgi:hypothetical protein
MEIMTMLTRRQFVGTSIGAFVLGLVGGVNLPKTTEEPDPNERVGLETGKYEVTKIRTHDGKVYYSSKDFLMKHPETVYAGMPVTMTVKLRGK